MKTPGLTNVVHQRYALIREPNEVRILRLVRDSGEISRIEIARLTKLHKASVTDYVSKLIKAGYLEETGKVASKSTAGRRRILLRFRPLSGIVAGVDIRMTNAVIAIADLNAKILQQETIQYSVETPAQEVVSKAASVIESLLSRARFPKSHLIGIGIGVQGVVDHSTNTIKVSQNKKAWEGECLSSYLESYFDVPVYVENDVKTMALGEYLLGAAKGVRDFVLIWIGTGLGAGILINGQLLHGVTFSAGEIGFNSLDFCADDRKRFPLTFRGQTMFGEILTDENLVESYRKSVVDASKCDGTVKSVAEAAKEGDKVALEIFDEFAGILSVLCIDLVNTLNPDLIVVGGEIARSYPKIAELLQQKIHQDLLVAPAEAVHVRSVNHGQSGVILGAVGLVLYELFEPMHSHSARPTRQTPFFNDSSMS